MSHVRVAFALFVVVGVGCKGVVVKPQDAPDARAKDGRSEVSGPILVSPDALNRDGQAGPEDVACSRSVNLRGITITRPVPFDVIIVADNTDSLSWSRDSLSSGLKNLLARVHGHEARFFVLTTTQYGASSQDAVSPLTGKDIVSWRDSVSRSPYKNEVTSYRQECTDGKGAPRTCPTSRRGRCQRPFACPHSCAVRILARTCSGQRKPQSPRLERSRCRARLTDPVGSPATAQAVPNVAGARTCDDLPFVGPSLRAN